MGIFTASHANCVRYLARCNPIKTLLNEVHLKYIAIKGVAVRILLLFVTWLKTISKTERTFPVNCLSFNPTQSCVLLFFCWQTNTNGGHGSEFLSNRNPIIPKCFRKGKKKKIKKFWLTFFKQCLAFGEYLCPCQRRTIPSVGAELPSAFSQRFLDTILYPSDRVRMACAQCSLPFIKPCHRIAITADSTPLTASQAIFSNRLIALSNIKDTIRLKIIIRGKKKNLLTIGELGQL